MWRPPNKNKISNTPSCCCWTCISVTIEAAPLRPFLNPCCVVLIVVVPGYRRTQCWGQLFSLSTGTHVNSRVWTNKLQTLCAVPSVRWLVSWARKQKSRTFAELCKRCVIVFDTIYYPRSYARWCIVKTVWEGQKSPGRNGDNICWDPRNSVPFFLFFLPIVAQPKRKNANVRLFSPLLLLLFI